MNALEIAKTVTIEVDEILAAAGSGCELDLLKEIVEASSNDNAERALVEWLLERCDETIDIDRALLERVKTRIETMLARGA